MTLSVYRRGDQTMKRICEALLRGGPELPELVVRDSAAIDPGDGLKAIGTRTRDGRVNEKHMVAGRGSVKVPADPKNKKTQDVWLRKGVPLIATGFEKHGIFNSSRATIVKVNSKSFTVRLQSSGVEVEFATCDFHQHWYVAYCVTIHKSRSA